MRIWTKWPNYKSTFHSQRRLLHNVTVLGNAILLLLPSRRHILAFVCSPPSPTLVLRISVNIIRSPYSGN
ncbi:unnamed protein product [Thlaspi arvense]|uniref:Uncharacterized protein n=1 Tax=Thlaspi arvense TaxID=13288 RepID=A0AAU9RIJ0_THLAR|nr:unnamed protein product [Thlaspi arvense]